MFTAHRISPSLEIRYDPGGRGRYGVAKKDIR